MRGIKSFRQATDFAAIGVSARDRCTLFLILFANHASRALSRSARLALMILRPGKLLRFSVLINGRQLDLTVRNRDRSDFWTLRECLTDYEYPIPARDIAHVFDAGGNIGLFSVRACALLKVDDPIIVEPNPENIALLKRNAASLSRARIVEGALTDANGTALFGYATPNSGHLVADGGHHGQKSLVRTFRLASLIPKEWNPERTWLKIDIEGAEYDVIRAMLDDGFYPKYLSVELHDFQRRNGDALLKRLGRRGYSLAVLKHSDDVRILHAQLVQS
jgi:FkbM family methyltransferase